MNDRNVSQLVSIIYLECTRNIIYKLGHDPKWLARLKNLAKTYSSLTLTCDYNITLTSSMDYYCFPSKHMEHVMLT